MLMAAAALNGATAQESEQWKYVGMSYFATGLPDVLYEGDGSKRFYVNTEESTTRPGVYRLLDPFADMPLKGDVTRNVSAENPPVMIVHTEDNKVWFESFDTGLSSEKLGGKIEFCSAASRMILDEGKSVDDAAEAGLTGFLRYNYWRFNKTYGDNEAAVLYVRTPTGTINANAKDGFVFQLPGENRIIDVITAETFKAESKGTPHNPGYMDAASGNPGIKSPATYHLKNAWKTLEESADEPVTVNEDGTFSMAYGTSLMNTVTGGKMRRMTVVLDSESPGFVDGRYSTSPFTGVTYVLVGSDCTKDAHKFYPYHGTGTAEVGKEREDYVYFKTGASGGAKVRRIEIEWEFDEGPCALPEATLSDNPEIYPDTDLFFTCKTLSSKTYYSVDGGEEIEVQPTEAVRLPWGRHTVKVTARRFRKQDSELVVNYKVLKNPIIQTDVIDLLSVGSGGTQETVGSTTGITYKLKGYSYPSDGYYSMYGNGNGVLAVNPGAKLRQVRVYHNAEAWETTTKKGTLNSAWKADLSDFPGSNWSGLKYPAKVTNAEMIADIAADRPSVMNFITYPDRIYIYPSDYTALRLTKVEFEWLASKQCCERPMFPDDKAVYSTTPIFLDCMTDDATFHVTVNGTDTPYDPAEGLLLPVGESVEVSAYATRDDSFDSEVSQATFHVAPASVADLAAFIAAGETSLPVAIEAPLHTIYRNGNEAYLTDGTSRIRLIADEADALNALAAGTSFTGLKALAVADAATPEIKLSELPEEFTAGEAPVFAVTEAADVAAAGVYSPLRVENASLAAAESDFTATAGDVTFPLTNRYADAGRFDAVIIEPEEGRLYNLEGLAAGSGLIATLVRPITTTPQFSLTDGSEHYEGILLEITCADADAEIVYTLNDGDETTYTEAIELPMGYNSVTACASAPGMDPGAPAEARFCVIAGIDTIGADLKAGHVEMFTIDGRRVMTANPAPGIYIVRSAGETYKIAIK